MEHDYDIRFHRTEPSSEEIQAKQDFSALLTQFAANPAPTEAKRRRLVPIWLSAAAGVALLLGAYFVLRPTSSSLSPTEYFAQRPFIDPPVINEPLPPFTIANQNQDYIEEALLQNDENRLVVNRMQLANDRGASPVELHHRTLDEVADFFMAGLPMSYDSANTPLQLDAAAVIDLFATAGGERIHLANNTSYGMDLSTTITANTDGSLPVFFLYQLDTTNRRWEYLSEVPAEVQNTSSNPLEDLAIVQDRRRLAADYAGRIAALENSPEISLNRPTPPINNAGGRPTLDIGFINELELAQGSNVGEEEISLLAEMGDWQITDELPLPDENAFSVIWEQVRLVKLGTDRYEMTLINPQRQERLIVRPIWNDSNRYATEQQRYQEELAAYEAAKQAASGERSESLNALAQQRDAALAAADQAIADYLNGLTAAQRLQLQQQRVSFGLELEALGTFAIARSFQAQMPTRPVELQDESGQTISGQTVYLNDGQHNTLYRYYANGNKTEIPMGSESTLWTVDSNGQLKLARGNEVDAKVVATRNLGLLPNNAAGVRRLLKE